MDEGMSEDTEQTGQFKEGDPSVMAVPAGMDENDYLEKVFEESLKAHGAPMSSAHVLAAVSGWTLGPDGEPVGHAEEVFTLGIVQGGYAIASLSQVPPAVSVDSGHIHMSMSFFSRTALEELGKSIMRVMQDNPDDTDE